MQQYKDYIKRLLEGNKINIERQHLLLFDDFLKDALITDAFNLIQKTQVKMIDNWKEKIRVEDILMKQIVLPNGTVGKPYEFIMDWVQLSLADIGNYTIEVDEMIGLIFSREQNKISGLLKEAGEHTVTLNFKLKTEAEEKPFHKKEIKLIVNPDPKTLWVNKDSDQQDKYWKKDNASACAGMVSKKLIVGSKRGRSHAQEGIFRDDDFEFASFDDSGWSIIAVADGAGGSKFSRKGSLIACKAIVEYFRNADKEKINAIELSIEEVFVNDSEENQKKLSGYFIELLGQAAFAAQTKIREEAASNNAGIKDYSTTLIYALVKKYASKYVIASFWVGDGGIGIYSKEKNEVTVLGIPDSGEFAGQTRFLTMGDIFADGAYANRVRFKIVEDFTALILMTDGITDPKFQTDNNLNKIEKWNELWEDLNGSNPDNCHVDFTNRLEDAEIKLMEWLDFWSAGNHDDRTIAILY